MAGVSKHRENQELPACSFVIADFCKKWEPFMPTCLPALAFTCLLSSPSLQALRCLPSPEHAVTNLGAISSKQYGTCSRQE
jgi:hypothetical protein